jgi:hypothetical protein
MKQTVEEEAIESCVIDRSIYNDEYQPYYLDGFKDGAEWQAKQSPWISVEERLPENTGWVFVAGGCYKYRVLFYCGGKFYTGKDLTTYDGGVLFWMPIPSFDQILEANKDVLQRLKEKGD